MAFPFFFKRYYSKLAAKPAKKLTEASKTLVKETARAARETGATPRSIIATVKQAAAEKKPAPSRYQGVAIGLQKLVWANKELQQAGVQALAKASVSTVLQEAIKAYCTTHKVQYDAALAEQLAGQIAAMPEKMLVSSKTGLAESKNDYAVRVYLVRLDMQNKKKGLPSLALTAPAWAAPDVAEKIKSGALIARGAEYANMAYEDAFLETPMPEFLDGVMLEGPRRPFF